MSCIAFTETSNINDHLCVESLIVNYALQMVPQLEISM